MKKLNIKIIIITISIFAVALITVGFVKSNQAVYMNIFPTNAAGTGSVVEDLRFSFWINGADPAPNVFVEPAAGLTFIGDNGGVANNLDFHRWASQMFLWILSPTPLNGSYGDCNSLVLTSPEFYDVDFSIFRYKKHVCSTIVKELKMANGFKTKVAVNNSMSFDVKVTNKGNKNLPLVFEKDTKKVFDVDTTPKSKNGNQMVYDDLKNKVEIGKIKTINGTPIFFDVQGKVIKNPTLILTEGLVEETTAQQFSSNNSYVTLAMRGGIVYIVILNSPAQAGASNVLMAQNGSLVYYNVMVNDIYAVFATMVTLGVLPNTSKFPTTQAELNVIKNYAAANNIPLVNTNDKALAMEIKTAWVENIQFTGAQNSKYILINSSVPNYILNSATNTWTINTITPKRQATLALVGMHVVGSVKGHPEMVWSTFEHVNNTPNEAFTYTDLSGGVVSVNPDVQDGDWLFCSQTATNSSAFNIPFINKSGNNLTATVGNSITPSNSKRIKAFGWNGPVNPTAAGEQEISFQEIANARLMATNTDVYNSLMGDDKRKYYFQVGATWNSKIKTGNGHVGSIALSNSTMETYTQDNLSCFSCHASEVGPNRNMPRLTQLSHVFHLTIQ